MARGLSVSQAASDSLGPGPGLAAAADSESESAASELLDSEAAGGRMIRLGRGS